MSRLSRGDKCIKQPEELWESYGRRVLSRGESGINLDKSQE